MSERLQEHDSNAGFVSTDRSERGLAAGLISPVDVELERVLEGLFRLSANRRFSLRQAVAVGAVVTRAGYAILRSLHDRGALSVRGLADACAMDAATASRQLMPLVGEGLVERRAADADARQVEVRLTPRGEAVYARIVAYRLDQLTGVLDAWSETDRSMLAQLVKRLVRDLARLPRASRSRRPPRSSKPSKSELPARSPRPSRRRARLRAPTSVSTSDDADDADVADRREGS